jgi:hypothetical protein
VWVAVYVHPELIIRPTINANEQAVVGMKA